MKALLRSSVALLMAAAAIGLGVAAFTSWWEAFRNCLAREYFRWLMQFGGSAICLCMALVLAAGAWAAWCGRRS